jgi:hypothetical protein
MQRFRERQEELLNLKKAQEEALVNSGKKSINKSENSNSHPRKRRDYVSHSLSSKELYQENPSRRSAPRKINTTDDSNIEQRLKELNAEELDREIVNIRSVIAQYLLNMISEIDLSEVIY